MEIPGPLSEGKPSPPAPKPEQLDFEVLTSRTTQMAVTESPAMRDLPPTQGTIHVTVQKVKDPGLPDPPPVPAVSQPDPAGSAKMEELRKHHRASELVFLSAIVYDHSRTFLQLYLNGNSKNQISAWSNLDFNHFSGFSTFRVKASDGTFRDYGLFMRIGDIDTVKLRERNSRLGIAFNALEIPALPDLSAGPAFVVSEGPQNGEAMDALSQLHDLYRQEGLRMAKAFRAREQAYAERKAYLLANPPSPDDVTLSFWKREKSAQSQPTIRGTETR